MVDVDEDTKPKVNRRRSTKKVDSKPREKQDIIETMPHTDKKIYETDERGKASIMNELNSLLDETLSGGENDDDDDGSDEEESGSEYETVSGEEESGEEESGSEYETGSSEDDSFFGLIHDDENQDSYSDVE